MQRVGIIGLGHMGLLHLRNCHFIENVQVIAVADKSKKGLAEAKARGVKQIYKDYKELLDKASIDAVIISLPNFLHEESICLAAERGLDIFVEKPLARNVEEGKRIKRSIEKNGIFLAIGHNYRYFNHVRQLKLAFDSGSIGDVEIANLEHFVNGPFAHLYSNNFKIETEICFKSI